MKRAAYPFSVLAVAALILTVLRPSLVWLGACLLVLALYSLTAACSLYRPPEDHLGVIYRFDRFERWAPPDEWIVRIPWVDVVRTVVNLQIRQVPVPLPDLVTRDQVSVSCEVMVTYRVDPRDVDRGLISQVVGFSKADWDGIITTTLREVAIQVVARMAFPHLSSVRGLRELREALGTQLSQRVRLLGLIVVPFTGVTVQAVRAEGLTARPSPASVDITRQVDGKIKVLFLAADPTDMCRLRLGVEFREIGKQLQLARRRDRFDLQERLAVRPVDITQALLDVEPHIVHFSGHGTSAGALCFENQVGEAQPVPADAMAALFEQFADQVMCVILNACYSRVQGKATAKHVPYVIGMNQAIGDEAAIAFAIGFYQALGAGRTIEDAYELGRVQIRLQGIPEQLTPVLLKKRVRSGQST